MEKKTNENQNTSEDTGIINQPSLINCSLLKFMQIMLKIIKLIIQKSLNYFSPLEMYELIQLLILCLKMMESMVDYVLERGNKHYGEFSHRGEIDQNSALFNHRKLLEYLFQDNETSPFKLQNQKRISDLKYEELSGQLNYFSEKLHGQLSKKHLGIDSDLYKLQNEWLRKKMPDFYCYYFLKFAYANTYSRMHELFLSEIQNMSREKDSHIIIKKTIQAREVCLSNLRRQVSSISSLDIQQSLESLRAQKELKKRKAIQNDQKGYKKKNKNSEEEVGKSWKNKLQIIFQLISHFRKLTAYVVELIKNWKNSIYAISQDPRRFRERVIFYHNDANYLLKMIFDNRFLFDSFLKKNLTFANHYDPFLLKPCMILENKKNKLTEDEQIFYDLIKPTEIQMDKMTKALVILAEEEYDQDEQSKFLNQRKNYGQLQHRKQFIEKRRDILVSKSEKNLGALRAKQQSQRTIQKGKDPKFVHDKKSDNTQNQIQEVKIEKEQQMSKSKIQASLNRIKKMRSVDLKKISPYLSRNQRIAKAQKVIELEHKFRVAQNEYVQSVKKQKQETTRKIEMKKQWDSSQKQIINNRIFNRYIEQNLKLMEEANNKAYVYKNKVSTKKIQGVAQNMDYNRLSFKDRKQAQYEKNLESYQRDDRNHSLSARNLSGIDKGRATQRNFRSNGTKAIIEISDKGVRSNQNIVNYELYGKKGKNVGKILQNTQKQQQMKLIEMKLNPITKQDIKKKEKEERQREQQMANSQAKNLFQSEQKPEIIIMRQEPQKIEQIKQFLYIKIKEQLLQQMKKNAQDKQHQINFMIQEEKRRKLQEIIQQRRLEQIRKKEQEERMRLAQLEKQRKKIDFQIKVQCIQYSQQNVGSFFDKLFEISPQTYHRMFLNEKLQQKKEYFMDQFYLMFLKGYLNDKQVAYCVVRYDWKHQKSRKFIIQYMVVHQFYHFISSFHQFCEYLWKNDPLDHIQAVVYNNAQNQEGRKVIQDLQQYANRRGQTFQRSLYSNLIQLKYVWERPKQHQNLQFPFKNFYFGKLFNLKSELLSSALSMNERYQPKIDMNLEVFTDYVFLIEQLFRKYLTPEEVVQLRQNSTNIRRLKDIFRIVLELQKVNPTIDELTVVEGLNLDDLYEKMKQKMKPPYDKYYWHHFYDKTLANRLLLSILQFKLDLQFPINSCYLDDRRFLRINPRRKVLVLRSSVYSREPIYVLNTNNSKIRMFFMDAQNYKLMRIQLFVFLNLAFNNIVEDTEKFVYSFWLPQFVINSQHGKQVKRITDFSISMKKSFFLSEEIYYANHQYIKNAISFLPKKNDVIYRESLIMGFLHTDIEAGSTGMPIYAKLIDRGEMFNQKS